MITRLGIALSMLTTAAVGPVSSLAGPPARTCRLVVDVRGDATAAPVGHDSVAVGTAPSDPSLDIVAADLSLSGRTLVTTIELQELTAPNPRSPMGQVFNVGFWVAGEHLVTVTGWVTLTGTRAQVTDGEGAAQTTAYPAAIRLDARRSVVSLLAPLSSISAVTAATRGSRLVDVTVASGRVLGASADFEAVAFVTADVARTEHDYIVGTPRRCR